MVGASIRARRARPSRELDLEAWEELVTRTRLLDELEPDAEALIVNRIGGAAAHAIAPIDECYRLVGPDQVQLGGDLRAAPAVEQAVRRASSQELRGAAA